MPILIGSAAMAGAAIAPPTTKAVEPSRSFFIILPLSLVRDWYVPKACPTGGANAANSTTHVFRQCGRRIETLSPNEGQEIDAPPYDSPRTCGVFVTISAAGSEPFLVASEPRKATKIT